MVLLSVRCDMKAPPSFHVQCFSLTPAGVVFFGTRRRARARRRTICSPERCSARVGVGEGAGARGLQSGVVAMCSSARVGVGEGAEASSSTNSGRPGRATGQLSGIWLGLWEGASGGAAQSASIFIDIPPNPGA
jgi:hypothetical protein